MYDCVLLSEGKGGGGVTVVAVYHVCYVACGLHIFPSQPLLCRPLSVQSATRGAGTFRLNSPLTSLASTSLRK